MNPSRLLLPALLAATLCACNRAPAPAADTAAAPPPAAAPAPAPPAAPSAEATATNPAAAQFAKMDIDGNGIVSPEEHAAGAAAMFRTMDSDADGKVTVAEMDAAQAALGGDPRMSSLQKIQTIDRDQDDVITADEHALGAQNMFGQMDVDASGGLSPAEFASGHAALLGGDAPPADQPPREP